VDISGHGVVSIRTDRLSRAFVLLKRKYFEEVALVARLLSRAPAHKRATTLLEEGVASWSVLDVGGGCATTLPASMWGGLSPDSRTVAGGVEGAVAVAVVVIVVGGCFVAVDVAVAVVVAVIVAVVDVGPVSCATRTVGVASFPPALISAVITPLAV